MINNKNFKYPVIIAGGGPVGLFLGLCLDKANIPFLILEKREKAHPNSRSIGIHPVTLELLEQLDIIKLFLSAGVKIRRGHAFTGAKKLGSISFSKCPKPFNFILTLPQYETERILEKQLRARTSKKTIIRRAEVTYFTQTSNSVQVEYCLDNNIHSVTGSYLVGCDGKHSTIRQLANIPFHGNIYPDTYIMGDFEDNTSFGADAAIFLCQEGLIESFPLPNKRRRWVVSTKHYHAKPNRSYISQKVKQRIDHSLNNTVHFMLSSFGVQKYIAHSMTKDHVILAGDAAHIINPIGGQGMNLGWLGAWDLSKTLLKIFNGKNKSSVFSAFESRRKKAARNAIKRAEINMRLGRRCKYSTLRDGLVRLMLTKPLSHLMARIFTMRGVERWII